jgi:alpha-amylase
VNKPVPLNCGGSGARRRFVRAIHVLMALRWASGSTSACRADGPAANNTVYEIFVRSFRDGGDANPAGDLKGLTRKLDYLNDGDPKTDTDLEVGILWLMPIFPSPSYHGYDVTDYLSVNRDYGSLQDLKDLLREAHRRGTRVILDVPFNHTSREHPWFKDAVERPEGGRRPYYFIRADGGRGGDGWHKITNARGERLEYFGLFGATMPDLNFDSAAVRREVKQVARFWLEQGVDGFRLDAAKHIYGWGMEPTEAEILKNNDWWHEFSQFVYGVRKDAVLVGEVLGDERVRVRMAWGLNGEIDESFMKNARAQLETPRPGFVGHWKRFVERARAENPAKPYDSFVFLSSHDCDPRLASELEKHAAGAADASYRMGMCLLMSIGTYPILYQGDELMERGRKWDGRGDGSGVFDETLREPFPWYAAKQGPGEAKWQPPGRPGFLPKFERPGDGVSVEEEERRPESVLHLVRALTNLRKKHPAFANGQIGRVLSDTAGWMVFERVQGQEQYLVLLNLTARGKEYRFHDQWYPEYRTAQLVFWSDGQGCRWRDQTGAATRIGDNVSVPPYGMVLLHR